LQVEYNGGVTLKETPHAQAYANLLFFEYAVDLDIVSSLSFSFSLSFFPSDSQSTSFI